MRTSRAAAAPPALVPNGVDDDIEEEVELLDEVLMPPVELDTPPAS